MIFREITKRFSLLAIGAFFMLMTGSSAWGQTTLVNYDFASTVAGTPCTASPLTTAAGVTSTFTTGGTGGGTCTTPAGTAAAAPPAFTANAANQSVSLTSFAAASTNYFQFQVQNLSFFRDYSLFFQLQRSGTGPVNADVQYSLNGTTFTTFQTITPPTAFATSPFTIDLTAVSAIENQPTVYFRIVGRDGTGAAGTFRIDNFQIQAFATPTAASVEVGGRVLEGNGRGVFRARVMMTDAQGNVRTTYTNSFGYYRFADVPAGQNYIFSAWHLVYQFGKQTQVRFISEEIDTVDFTALDRSIFDKPSAPEFGDVQEIEPKH